MHAEENAIDPRPVYESPEKLETVLETEKKMRSLLKKAVKTFGRDMVPMAGPDCGLSSWKYQKLARELLMRVKSATTGT